MSYRNIILILHVAFFLSGCLPKHPEPLLTYPQNVNFLEHTITQREVAQKDFIYRYYKPWFLTNIETSKEDARWSHKTFGIKKRYYGETMLPIPDEAIEKIIENTNFDAYGSLNQHAIMVQNAQMRNLPTDKPFFKKTTLPGEGFPFDYLQNSRININEPIMLSHYSKDGAWAFVKSSFSMGWLHVDTFVQLDASSRTALLLQPKIVITTDNTPLYSDNNRFLTYSKIGTLLPTTEENNETYSAYMYHTDAKNEPAKVTIKVSKKDAKKFPIDFEKQNVKAVVSSLLGENYGWGGYLGNRDCSAMTRDYFTPFGVWIPRNSGAQKNFGKYISLKNLSNEEKEAMIVKNAIPFVSLLYLSGHIMLYAGEFDNKAMVVHNTWGVKTLNDGKEGRKIIGKAIVSDLHVGENQPDVPNEALLISRVEGIVVEPSKNSIETRFKDKYPSIKNIKDNSVYFADGSSLAYDDGQTKTFEQKLENADIEDQISQSYPAFAEIVEPKTDEDPGRFRNEAFFKKLYGETEDEVRKNLAQVIWLPKNEGAKIYFNGKENAAKQLQKVSNELDKLPTEYLKYVKNINGTFAYRNIAGTKRLSAHSYGIAIDLNTQHSAYWKWDKQYRFSNAIPKIIVDIFERYGFVWGGRWYHYDTMHFEYRPELFKTID
ncbi:MAG: SH3 domain-containing protein [Sulfurospirillaceae bacterium]|nr:SH3 domain-containing protein [Sulfurospirillaceae bacterium]